METYKIGVFGSASGSEVDGLRKRAHLIGFKICALGKGILCTGACPGLPHQAALGAHEAGGTVLGFSPAMNMRNHEEDYRFPVSPYTLIFTGMEKKGRNLICTRTCDAGIFIAGRWGTLNEFTLMCDEGDGKVIGLLEGSGGFVDSKIIPGLEETEKPTKAIIVIESDVVILVEKIFQELNKRS